MQKTYRINTVLYNIDEIKKYFFDNKLKNVILFSQARSGSTFVSNILSEELDLKKNFFSEEFFINKHFSYLKKFIEIHNNFFINTNEFVYKRTDLKKKQTLHIYLHRNHLDILDSYKIAKEKGFYLGWEEFYLKYKIFFPELKEIKPVTLFNHKVWEKQIQYFEHGLTLSYESLKDHPKFISKKDRLKNISSLKKIDGNKEFGDYQGNKWKEVFSKDNDERIKFNFFEKIYFKFRRYTESRKKSLKNY
jgi:hypothetical protein